MNVETLIRQLGLKPHPGEGGYYRETYRSAEAIAAAALPPRYAADRCFATAIYYLVTPDSFSSLHRLQSDEVFHFYLGDAVTMLRLHTDGRGETVELGQDIAAGQQLQVVVPRGVWQGCHLQPGGKLALLGATVSPGFEFADFEIGLREALVGEYPDWKQWIERLTRPSS